MNGECGIWPGMTRAQYEEIPAANQSTLKLLRRSPAHCREARIHPKPATPAMELGTLIHCALLEPKRLEVEYVEMPDLTIGITNKDGSPSKSPKNTDAYRRAVSDFGREHVGQSFVEAADLETCRSIGEAIAAHETASALLTGPGDNEVGIVWRDPETGLLCKGLIDRLTPGAIIDLKTMEDASKGAVRRSATSGLWHFQAAWYRWGLASLGKGAPAFRHICVETLAPFGVRVVRLGEKSIERGEVLMGSYLTQYAECLRSGRWPNYPDVTTDLDVLPWELNDLED